MSRTILTTDRIPVTSQGKTDTKAVAITNASGKYVWSTADIPASDVFTFSAWVYVRDISTSPVVIQSDSGKVSLQILSDGRARIAGYNSTPTLRVRAETVAGGITLNTWHHILMAVNVGAGAADNLTYLDNEESNGADKYLAATDAVDFSGAAWSFGLTANNDWDIAELWFGPGFFLDVSDSTVRERFIKNGRPVELGSEGQNPLDGKDAPYAYFSGDASDFFINRGKGPDLTDSSMSPAAADASSIP